MPYVIFLRKRSDTRPFDPNRIKLSGDFLSSAAPCHWCYGEQTLEPLHTVYEEQDWTPSWPFCFLSTRVLYSSSTLSVSSLKGLGGRERVSSSSSVMKAWRRGNNNKKKDIKSDTVSLDDLTQLYAQMILQTACGILAGLSLALVLCWI